MIMKKLLITAILSTALALSMAGSALAAFADLELVRVVLQQSGGVTEIATDLGNVSTALAGGTFGGGADAFTSKVGGTNFAAGPSGLNAVYFAVNTATKELWITGLDPSISAGKSTTITGLTTNIFTYYNGLGGTTVLADASYASSYRVKADATTQFGQFGTAIVLAARPYTEANLAPLASGGSVSQTLYHFANYAVASAGVAVATITTNSNGSTTISAPTSVNGVCGAADGVPVATVPTSGLCSSGSPSSVTGFGPWNWTCDGQNGGTNAACSAPVLQTTITPTITWAPPAAITYGTALSATQLNATASEPVTSANVPGTFAYSPPLGSVLAAGTQALSVIFTPTDTAKYTTETATVNLVVNKKALTVTANNLSKSVNTANPTLTYAVSGYVNGDTAAVLSGAPAMSTTATTSSPAGTYPITAAAGTLAATNYSFTFAPGTLTVTGQNVPTITWATPAAITYGTALSATQLNATASVPGTFAYTPAAGSVPAAGTQTLSVIFTPTDSVNNSTATATVNLVVNKKALTVTANNLSKSVNTANPTLTYAVSGYVNGDTAAVLSGAPAMSTTATTSSPAGTYPITAAAGTLAATNYSFTFAPGTLTVTGQNVPTITWATPAAITYGTALSATQLNATASVPGTFAYTPAAGSVPAAGTQTLSVIFTPTDSVNNSTATATVNLVVNKKALTVTANNLSKSVNTANPTLTYAVTGFVNNDTAAVLSGAPAMSTTALTNSPAGTYPITAAAGTLAATNYSFTFAPGTLTVTGQTVPTKRDQAIRALRFTPQKLSVNGTAIVWARATSRLPVFFTSMTPSVCSVKGRTVTGVTAGTCTIAADQPGDANYNAAPQVTHNVSVDKKHQNDHDSRHAGHMFRQEFDRD